MITLARQLESLPTFSSTSARLLQLLNDPSADNHALEALLVQDPALTANLLRLANSSFYRGSAQVITVRQAVTRLGFKEVYSLASSMAFAQILPETLPGYGIDAHAFWKHSLAVGVLSDKIVSHLGLDVPEAFTAGLLHDIGKLAIGVFLEKGGETVRQKLGGGVLTMLDIERTLLGTDHAEVGFTIAERWNLPSSIALAARYHHHPLQAPEGHVVCNVVHVANGMAHLFGYVSDIGEMSREVDSVVLGQLGLGSDDLQEIASNALGPIRDMGGVLEF